MKNNLLILFLFSFFLSIKYDYAQVVSPADLQCSITEQSKITLRWSFTSIAATGFVIESSIGTGDKWSVIDSLPVNISNYEYNAYLDGIFYYFRVYALYDSIKSDYSNVASIYYPLIPPTNLKLATLKAIQIDLSWEDNSQSEIGYKVERKMGETGIWQIAASLPSNSGAFSDTVVADGWEYFYRIAAFDAETTSKYSDEIKIAVPISTPSDLSYELISNNKIVLSWADNSKSETAFILQQKIGSTGIYNSISELDPNTLNYEAENLVSDTTYYFRIFCYNSQDTSGFSNEIKYSVPTVISVVEETSSGPFSFNMELNLGMTFSDRSSHNSDRENLEWLLGTNLLFGYTSENFQFDLDLFLQYGQLVAKNTLPVKTQDNLIINLMPSIKFIASPAIRLFIQTKAETQIAKGFIDDQETNFADPMFLTHTLFLGNKNQIITLLQDLNFKVVYGIGYSFQQIIRKNFQLISEIQSNSDIEYLDGPSAVFNLLFKKSFGKSVSSSISINTLLMARKEFFNEIKNSRFSSLIVASLSIDLFTIKYTNRMIYDSDISTKRQLDQSLVLSLQLNL